MTKELVRAMGDPEKAGDQHSRMDELAAIVEHSDDAIIGKTLDGVITSWNRAAERMYGYSSEQAIGRSVELVTPEDRIGEVKAILAKIRAGEHVDHFETVHLRKDGTLFEVSISVSPICDAGGVVVGASSIARDITRQRHEVDAARSMIESSLDSLVSISPEGLITDANEATVKVTGVSRDNLIGTSFSDYFTDPEKAEEIYQRVFQQGMAVDYPLTLRRRDGDETLTEVRYNASLYRDAGGNVLGVFAAARDVTKQVQAFEAARSMLETSQDSLVAISPEGRITDVNEATVKVTGVPREELIGTAFSGYFTDPDKADGVYQRAFTQGMAGEYPLTIRRRDGTLAEVMYYASAYRDLGGNVLGVFAAARNVTKQVQAFEAARSMIESSLDSLVAINPEGKITDANEATVKVTGVSRENLIGTAFSDYFTEPDHANRIYQMVFTHGMAADYPLTMRHKDGTLTEVLYNASVYHDASGNVLGVFAAARDVTKQVRAQAEIARQLDQEVSRLAELQRFQQVSVGREFKMIELKKEIERLTRLVPADEGEPQDGDGREVTEGS